MVTAAGKKVTAKKSAVDRAKMAGAANKMAQNDAPKVTEAKEWKKAKGHPLSVPSGNVALVRPVGMQAFLTKGMIPNSLREIALAAINQKKAPELDMDNVTTEQIEDMLVLFDSVTCYCVIEPKVTPVPTFSPHHVEDGFCTAEEVGSPIPQGHELREEDVLYVDDVDLDDKVFIFQFAAGGTRDLESFRAEYASRMEHLSGEQNLENKA